MHMLKQLLEYIPEIITINNGELDLEVEDVVNNYETVFHLYMTFIIESILRKTISHE